MLPESRRIYEQAFQNEAEPSLYGFPWWLDATCGSAGWNVYEVSDETDKPSVLIPYCHAKIKGMNAFINPPMSQWLPILKTDAYARISLVDFIESLKAYSILDMSFRPEKNMLYPGEELPVHFKYSYLISPLQTKETIRSKYNDGLRRNLKLAEDNYTIEESDDIRTFLMFCTNTYHQRKIKSPKWLHTTAPEVIKALKKHQMGKLEFALENGKPVAGILTGWDKQTSYYLMAGRSGEEIGVSAHSLLLDNAVMEANEAGRTFDFEGSMHAGIANFFHSFGAAPQAYWQIKRFKGAGKLWALFH